jgi:hypothetical protein
LRGIANRNDELLTAVVLAADEIGRRDFQVEDIAGVVPFPDRPLQNRPRLRRIALKCRHDDRVRVPGLDAGDRPLVLSVAIEIDVRRFNAGCRCERGKDAAVAGRGEIAAVVQHALHADERARGAGMDERVFLLETQGHSPAERRFDAGDRTVSSYFGRCGPMHRQHQGTGQLPEARQPGYANASLAFPLFPGSARRGNGKLARQ